MIHLDDDYYNDLAQELITLIYDKGEVEGVVELRVRDQRGRAAEVIFGFNASYFTLERGLESMNYILIALVDSRRCSTDFEPSRLATILDF